MGTFKTTTIEFEGQVQRIEDLIGRARYHAQTNRLYAMEVMVHLLDHARQFSDAALFDVCREMMEVVHSPSPYPISPIHQHAGDDNNRPTTNNRPSIETPYDNSLDGIFDDRVKVSAVKKKLDELTFKRNGRVDWFVIYKVFLHLKWLKEGCGQKAFLQWVNLQYHCGWTGKQHLTFSRDVDKSMRSTDISQWRSIDYHQYTKGEVYYNFAILLRKTFVHVIVNGRESSEPMTDFSMGKNRDKASFMMNPGQLINLGK